MIIAVTGHRPDKLGGYSVRNFFRLVDFAKAYFSENKPTQIYTGMAIGWDLAVAYAAYDLNIPYVAVIPFRGQELKWPQGIRNLYRDTVSMAMKTVIVSEGGYSVAKLHKRNRYLVDHAQRLVALWNGHPSGTAGTVRYAIQREVPVTNLWSLWERRPKPQRVIE